MSSVEALSKFMHRLVESERYGGRTILASEDTVIMYDCGTWSDAHSQAVHVKFPECEISILPSSASLSGFMVLAKIHKEKGLFWWTMAACGAAAFILATARHMLMMNTA